MTILHHPSDDVLMQYAGGTIDGGLAIVVAIHLAHCPVCSTRVAEFEAVGGEILEDMPITLMAPEALAQVLAKIETSKPIVAPRVPKPKPRLFPEGIKMPAALQECEIGSWWILAPGLRGCRVKVPGVPKANVMLLRGRASAKLPSHGHSGIELTQVIAGSFSNPDGRFGAGDMAEADVDVDHQPIVDVDGECICIVASEGRARLHGFCCTAHAAIYRPLDTWQCLECAAKPGPTFGSGAVKASAHVYLEKGHSRRTHSRLRCLGTFYVSGRDPQRCCLDRRL